MVRSDWYGMFFCNQAAEWLESDRLFWPSQRLVCICSIPACTENKTKEVPFILTAGMIPPDQASPVVGMAGTGPGLADPPCQLRAAGARLTPGRGHAGTAGRRTPNGDELAGHQPRAAPEPFAAPASKSSGERVAGVDRGR